MVTPETAREKNTDPAGTEGKGTNEAGFEGTRRATRSDGPVVNNQWGQK